MFTSEFGSGGFLCRGFGGGHASSGHSSSSHSSSHSSESGHFSESEHSQESSSYYHSGPTFFFFGGGHSSSSASPAVSPTATVTMTGTPSDFNPDIIDTNHHYVGWIIGIALVVVTIGVLATRD